MVRRFAVIAVAVLLAAMLSPAHAAGDVAPAARPRFSVAPEKVRVVFDLPREMTFTDQSTPAQIQVAVATTLQPTPQPISVNDPVVKEIAVSAGNDGQSLLTVNLLKPRKAHIFTMPAAEGKPFRLVVDVLKDFSLEERRALSPAVTYIHQEKQAGDRYLALHILEINANDPKIHIRPVMANGERERICSMVTRTGAVCGINGGFFWQSSVPAEPADCSTQPAAPTTPPTTQGATLVDTTQPAPAPIPPPKKTWTRPVGLLKVDGEVRAMPIWGRTAIAFPAVGPPVVGNPAGCWQVRFADGSNQRIPDWLDASILAPRPSAIVVSGRLTNQVEANPNGLTALIRDGKVALRTNASMPLAKEELALYLTGDCAKTLDAVLPAGATVSLTPCIDGGWEQYLHAVGAGPRLLRNGTAEITGQLERFQPDILFGRRARTGLGVTNDGRLVV
ncbi:MAG TPA: phosphodiester glycosidase family protein, partial [Armatimonadota bacterium]